MKTLRNNTILLFFFLVLLCPRISTVTAQNNNNSSNSTDNNQFTYQTFNPSMAVIITILVAALFFMGFFSIYIRHCSDSSGASGSIRRGISMRGRRAAAARGLDASVIESFPTFTYAEVKDHKIGKGALECAVCLNEFEDEETLRLLPKCDHVFHPECVDAWLESHVTCPVCRANLVPQAGDEVVVAAAQIAETDQPVAEGGSVHRTGSMNDGDHAVVIQINDENNNQIPQQSHQGNDANTEYQNRSIKRRMFSFSRYRSHSTGHDSVVQPGENLDRFTLRLPAGKRKEVIGRAAFNRTRSFAVTTLPREGSTRRGYRPGGEGSSRAGRFFRRTDTSTKSDRWDFFTRAFSMKSPRVVADQTGAEGSKRGGGSIGRTAVKMPSFKCLETPSVSNGDEIRLVSSEPDRSDAV